MTIEPCPKGYECVPALYNHGEMGYHVGRIYKGDVLVIEINNRLVPKRPWDPSPQWFVATEDGDHTVNVGLSPMKDSLEFKPRIYVVGCMKL